MFRALSPFGSRLFALYWAGNLVSNTGRWIELTGTVWLVYELTDDPVLLGLLGIARALPTIGLSPIAGVVADRVDQRYALIITQSLALLASSILCLLIATGQVTLWHVYLQVAIQTAVRAFDTGVRQALFPRLVPREHLAEAVTLHSASGRAAAFVGPALGGLAIASYGVSAPFLLNAASFLVLIGAVLAIGDAIPGTGYAASSFREELIEGLHHIIDLPVLRGLLRLEIVFGVFHMNPVMITIVGLELLHVAPQELGALLSAPALGATGGIVALIALGQPGHTGRFVILCTIGYAAVLLMFAAAQTYVLAFIGLVAIGLLDAMVSVTRNSIAQLVAHAHMRGRVMANIGTVSRGVSPLAQTQSGLLSGAIGPEAALLAASVALAATAAVTASWNRSLWTYSRVDNEEVSVPPPTGER